LRKPRISILVILTMLFAAFTLGFMLGGRQKTSDITVSVSRELLKALVQAPPKSTVIQPEKEITFPISINHADKDTLTALPGIGDVLAQRIISYRERNGYFSSVEELGNVEGIGEKRLEEILDLIVIGG